MKRILALSVTALLSSAAVAQVTISSLPAASTLSGNEVIPIVQSGSTRQATTSAIARAVTKGAQFSATGGIGDVTATHVDGELSLGKYSFSGLTGIGSVTAMNFGRQGSSANYDASIFTLGGSGANKGTMVLNAGIVNLQGILSAFKPMQLQYSGVPGDGGQDAVGQTEEITNTGTNGGNAERLDYFAGRNTTGTGFEVGKSFYAHCDGIQGGQCLAYFGVAQSPNNNSHSWGVFGYEINSVNLGGDYGWANQRGALPRWTGGGQFVPESHDFFNGTGAGAYPSLFGVMIGHSADKSIATGYFTQTYNGLLIEPDAIAPGGMGIQIAGAEDRTTTGTLPAAAFRAEGGFSTAVFDTRSANITNGIVLNMSHDQGACFISGDGCLRWNSSTGTLVYSVGGGTPWSVTNGGHMSVPKAGGAFTATSNYVGSDTDSAVAGISGTPTSPDTNQGAAGLFEKSSSALAFNALAGLANKTSSAANVRATGVYGEAVDPVGGVTSFVEGGRFQGTLTGGVNGAAYGVVCAAGTTVTGPTTPAYLVGCEGEVDNQIGPDAPTFGTFNKDRFSASFVATNGAGSGTRYKADAAFIANPYSLGKYQTGLLLTSAVTNAGIAATTGTSLVAGIDLHLASLSFATLIAPNNAPIRFENAAGTTGLSVLNLDASGNLQIGADAPGQAVVSPPLYLAKGYAQLAGTTYSALPTCGTLTAGTIAYITDASAAITAWHQQVTAGGGTNKAFVACNGTGWFAYDY